MDLNYEIEVIEYSKEALESAAVIFREYANSLDVDLCFQGFDQEMSHLAIVYAKPKGCILLAKYQDDVIGGVALKQIGEGVSEMKRLYVKPKFRGFGIAKSLVDSLIQKAKEANYSIIKLDTLSTMTAAIALYTSFGFVPTGQYVHNPIETALFFELDLTKNK